MNLIHTDFEILEQEPGLKGVYKAAEYPGRICYGSTDKITEDSAQPFVENTLMKSNHGAPLEHAAVYLKCPENVYQKYVNNKYSRTNYHKTENDNGPITWLDTESRFGYLSDTVEYYVSTNLRVLYDNKWLDDLKYICERTQYHTRRVTVKFTCDIGVSREYNRHRNDSINEESTRYCNYAKDKYGKSINIIEPVWLYEKDAELKAKINNTDFRKYINWIHAGQDDLFSDIDYWLFANLASEWSYMNLVEKCQWKQQQARSVLPLDTKTTLIHTAFVDDWVHFFNLRAIGTTGAPHPQAKELAEPLMNEFIKRNYLTDELKRNLGKKQNEYNTTI